MGKKYATGNNQLTKFDNYRPNNIKGIDLTINNFSAFQNKRSRSL